MFGDPHIYTFDDLPYTFNGKGEFVLVRVDSVRHKLDVQGRFEQISPNYMKEAKGSMLTSVAGVCWGGACACGWVKRTCRCVWSVDKSVCVTEWV